MSHFDTTYYLYNLVWNTVETPCPYESFHTFSKFINSSTSLFASILPLIYCDILQKSCNSHSIIAKSKIRMFPSALKQNITSGLV